MPILRPHHSCLRVSMAGRLKRGTTTTCVFFCSVRLTSFHSFFFKACHWWRQANNALQRWCSFREKSHGCWRRRLVCSTGSCSSCGWFNVDLAKRHGRGTDAARQSCRTMLHTGRLLYAVRHHGAVGRRRRNDPAVAS